MCPSPRSTMPGAKAWIAWHTPRSTASRIQFPSPIFVLDHRSAGSDAGVVAQELHRAEARQGRVAQRVHLLALTDVADHRFGLHPLGAGCRGHGVERLLASRRDDQVHALVGQGQGQGAADAAAGPRSPPPSCPGDPSWPLPSQLLGVPSNMAIPSGPGRCTPGDGPARAPPRSRSAAPPASRARCGYASRPGRSPRAGRPTPPGPGRRNPGGGAERPKRSAGSVSMKRSEPSPLAVNSSYMVDPTQAKSATICPARGQVPFDVEPVADPEALGEDGAGAAEIIGAIADLEVLVPEQPLARAKLPAGRRTRCPI